jgi:exodeoxyribonuclease VII large subunit
MLITVTQLNNYLKATVDMDSNINSVTVRGEATNVKQAYGNTYFSLKDEYSQIDCVSFVMGDTLIKNGSIIEATGSVNFLTKSGRISFNVKSVAPSKELGEQYIKLLQLTEKLKKMGIFDDSRKIPVPNNCRRVGIVTSKDGAVRRDIEEVIHRRQPYTDMFLYPVHVQGETAAAEIAAGVQYFNDSDVDVIIVGRGGGSNEDLSVFNDERVVMAVSACHKPVVSAVGHGVDFTLCDYTADKRAVTPSEAAEYVTTDVNVVLVRINSTLTTSYRALSQKISTRRQFLQGTVKAALLKYQQRISTAREHINTTLLHAEYAANTKFTQKSNLVDAIVEKMSLSNPLNVLKRGYSIVSIDGVRVNSVNDTPIGSVVDIKMTDGIIVAAVQNIKE